MESNNYFIGTLVWLLLAVFTVCPAAAAVQLTVTPVGSHVFVLQGRNLEGIAVLDLEFGYDPSLLANPRGIRGGLIPPDAIFNCNASVPGQIRLFIRIGSRAVNGSGALATLSFDGIGDVAGSIQSLTANIVTVKATPVVAGVQILSQQHPPAVAGDISTPAADRPFAETDGGSSSVPVVATGPTGTVAGFVAPGTVSMPPERAETEPERQERSEASTSFPDDGEQLPPVQTPPAESVPSHAEPSVSVPAAQKKITYQSVLERMKAYRGEKTPATMTALFTPAADQSVRQEPSVAVSDGESVVVIHVDLSAALKDSPSFSFMNAGMVSLEPTEDGGWLIGLIPKKGVMDARITVSFEGSTLMYPLVVVPPIDPLLLTLNGSQEAALIRFLKPNDGARDPRFDLNGDGRFDYIDDYMFTAHYLAAGRKPAVINSGEQQPQRTP